MDPTVARAFLSALIAEMRDADVVALGRLIVSWVIEGDEMALRGVADLDVLLHHQGSSLYGSSHVVGSAPKQALW